VPPGVREAHPGHALTGVGDGGVGDGGQGGGAVGGVVAESLHVENTSIGGEADLPRGEVGQPPADGESEVSSTVVSVRSARPFQAAHSALTTTRQVPNPAARDLMKVQGCISLSMRGASLYRVGPVVDDVIRDVSDSSGRRLLPEHSRLGAAFTEDVHGVGGRRHL
jgi:hypothetical protein